MRIVTPEPSAFAGRAPSARYRGRGIWADGIGWATADLDPGGYPSETARQWGRWHRTLRVAREYIAGHGAGGAP